MITDKIDKYLKEEDFEAAWYPHDHPKRKGEKLGSPMGKVDMKAIGYKETNAKCCGTCVSYQGELCKNVKNLRIFFKKTKLPPGVGLQVDSIGICPNYESQF